MVHFLAFLSRKKGSLKWLIYHYALPNTYDLLKSVSSVCFPQENQHWIKSRNGSINRQLHNKNSPISNLTLHSNLPTMLLNNLFGNIQAQTTSMRLAQFDITYLGKAIKNRFLVFFADTNTIVFNFNLSKIILNC